jgi:hypothetical protein
MAFKLNNQFISIDRPFTAPDGTKYANLRDPAIRAALGVEEVADAPTYDQRFYWGVDNPKLLNDREESDEQGNPLWVQEYNPLTETMQNTNVRLVTKGLKSQWIAQVKATAGSLLAQTDWYVIRKAERSIDIPAGVETYRAAVVTEANRLEAAIAGVTSVEQLSDTVNTMNWPKAD